MTCLCGEEIEDELARLGSIWCLDCRSDPRRRERALAAREGRLLDDQLPAGDAELEQTFKLVELEHWMAEMGGFCRKVAEARGRDFDAGTYVLTELVAAAHRRDSDPWQFVSMLEEAGLVERTIAAIDLGET